MLELPLRPGARVAGRYLLLHRCAHSGAAPSTTWAAVDEALCRPVWVTVLAEVPAEEPAGGAVSPQVAAIRRAARAAAGLGDPRFLRIYDLGVEVAAGPTGPSTPANPSNPADPVDPADPARALHYLVTEAPAAPTLVELLASGPLPAAQAHQLALLVADALATAHRAGLRHDRLRPEDIHYAGGDTVTITGLAVAAAGYGEDSGTDDALACGAVLYAALTGHWPGPSPTGLPAAPHRGAHARPPARLRAGVPAALDAVARRALGLPARGWWRPAPSPLVTPRQVFIALAAAPVEYQPPSRHLVLWGPGARVATGGAVGRSTPWLASRVAGRATDWAAPLSAYRRTVVAGAVAAALLAVAQVALPGFGPAPLSALGLGSSSPAAGAGPAAGRLTVHRVAELHPAAGRGPVDGLSDPAAAVDDDVSTAWQTPVRRRDPSTGPAGVDRADHADPADLVGEDALLLDLGEPVPIRTVELVLLGRPTDLELRVSDAPGVRTRDFRLVATVRGSGSRVSVALPEDTAAQFVLVRLTRLPALLESAADVRGGVAEIALRS